MNKLNRRRNLDSKINKLFEKLTITKRAFEKMNTYARIVSELADNHIECGGLMIGEHQGGIPIVTDAVLLDGVVTHASGNFDYDRMNEEYIRARDNGKVVMGMWHSHGNFGVFHSSHDDSHLDILLDRNTRMLPNLLLREEKVSKVNERYIKMDEKGFTIEDSSGNGAIRIRFEEKNHDALREALSTISGIYTQETKGIPFAASVVINKRSYNSAERIEKPIPGESVYIEAVAKISNLKKKTLKRRDIGIEIIQDDYVLNELQMYEEVGKKVIYRGEKLERKMEAPPVNTEESELEEKLSTEDTKEEQHEVIEEKIEDDEIAKRCDKILQIPEYVKSITKKILRKHHLLKERRLVQKIGYEEIARRYDELIHSPAYVKAINKKIMHRYTMLKAKRMLDKLGPESAQKVYASYKRKQKEQNGKTQEKTA